MTPVVLLGTSASPGAGILCYMNDAVCAGEREGFCSVRAFAAGTSIRLAKWPSPVTELLRIQEGLGSSARLFAKRDDLIEFGLGGTKVRSLEMLARTAVEAKADVLVTAGGRHSNCVRLVSALAVALGVECVAVVDGARPKRLGGNLLLAEQLGARLQFVDTRIARQVEVDRVIDRFRHQSRCPFEVPVSAATSSAVIAVAAAVGELPSQMPIPSLIVVCSSSGITQAGLILGCALLGFRTRVIGVTPDDEPEQVRNRVRSWLREACRLLNTEKAEIVEARIEVEVPLEDNRRRLRGSVKDDVSSIFARREGILLDPHYSAKSASVFVRYVLASLQEKDGTLLFWHTGGLPNVFG